MITLDVYSVGTAVILGSAGVALYKNWKYGRDLAALAKEHLIDEMRSAGYEVHCDNYGGTYFVKGDKSYSYEMIHDIATSDDPDWTGIFD